MFPVKIFFYQKMSHVAPYLSNKFHHKDWRDQLFLICVKCDSQYFYVLYLAQKGYLTIFFVNANKYKLDIL